MPYVIFIIGLLVGVFALFRFFQEARPAQVITLLQTIFMILLLLACLFLALTGRMGPAIVIIGVMLPMAAHYFFQKRQGKAETASQKEAGHTVTVAAEVSSLEEALEILELDKNASKEDIKMAYKTLMKKYHPDQGGNDYFSRKLTAARDYLLAAAMAKETKQK